MINIKKLLKSTYFYCVLVLIILIAMIVAVVNVQLWSYLEEYETSTPKYFMDNVLNRLKTDDYTGVMDLLGVEETDFIKEKDYIDYLNGIFGEDKSKLELYSAGREGDKTLYEIAPSGKNGIKLELTSTKGGSSFSFTTFDVKHIDLKTKSMTLTAPKDVVVLANGNPVTKTHGMPVPVKSFEVLNDKSIIPTLAVYKIDGFLSDPEITLQGLSPSEYNISKTNAIAVNATGDVKTMLEEFSKTAAVTYAKYVSKDANFGDYSKYIYAETEYYKSVSGFSNFWYIDHDPPTVEELKCENILKHSDNTYTVEVSFVYKVTTRNERATFKQAYNTRYQLSLIKVNDTFKIVNLLSI